jgi:hypothetical protein
MKLQELKHHTYFGYHAEPFEKIWQYGNCFSKPGKFVSFLSQNQIFQVEKWRNSTIKKKTFLNYLTKEG